MFFALRIEKFKKSNNIYAYKEIISLTEDKRLDEIEKAQEYGKSSDIPFTNSDLIFIYSFA